MKEMVIIAIGGANRYAEAEVWIDGTFSSRINAISMFAKEDYKLAIWGNAHSIIRYSKGFRITAVVVSILNGRSISVTTTEEVMRNLTAAS